MWWILGSVCTLITLTLLGLAGAYLLWLRALEAARAVKLERTGRVVKARIVFGQDRLFRDNQHPNDAVPVVVVFTPEQAPPDLDQVLERLAAAARRCSVDEYEDDDERLIGQAMRSKSGYPLPLRIPRRLTGGREGYFVTVSASRKLLPGRRGAHDHIYCKAYLGKQRNDRAARMVAYPPDAPADRPQEAFRG